MSASGFLNPGPRPPPRRALTVFGVLILLVPMLGAVGYASVKLDQLARQGQAVVQDSVQATQSSQRVLNLLTQLERHARQYLVLNDPALLDLYEQTREELSVTLAGLARLPQDETTRAARAALTEQARALGQALAPPAAQDPADVAPVMPESPTGRDISTDAAPDPASGGTEAAEDATPAPLPEASAATDIETGGTSAGDAAPADTLTTFPLADLPAPAADALFEETALLEALTPEALNTRLAELSAQATTLSRAMRALMDDELAALETSVRRTRQALAWQTVLLVPTVALLMAFLYLQLLRPLRQIDAAIARLGEERLDEAIAIGGPQDLRALGRQLEWLRERLSELAQEKSRFLRHMSHELKTPLANIREGTELLLDGAVGKLSPSQEEVTRILRDNGLRLQQLIENLLSFSAWQSRNATLELSDFRLGELLREVLRRHRLVLASQQLKLKTQLADIAILADYDKLRLVMENLISNAIKYSPRHGTIHLHAAADDDWVQLDVADDGPGIPMNERKRVFEAFYQGAQRANTHVGGTGIGLSVVLECVTAHGGTVTIVDGEFRGAHFRVRIPMRQAAVSPRAALSGTGA
ncbi:MAG: hypothetical protein JJU27_11800 [Gammaproteobacteria bacterium]|nr:hypothetical protein [Gammaproteobacteria bacterium]